MSNFEKLVNDYNVILADGQMRAFSLPGAGKLAAGGAVGVDGGCGGGGYAATTFKQWYSGQIRSSGASGIPGTAGVFCNGTGASSGYLVGSNYDMNVGTVQTYRGVNANNYGGSPGSGSYRATGSAQLNGVLFFICIVLHSI